MVIPIHDRNPTHRTPVVTYLLLAVNVVAFLLSPVVTAPLLGGAGPEQVCEQVSFFADWGAIPEEVLDNEPLGERVEPIGGGLGCQVGDPGKSPFLSILTAMFLHGGWVHLLGNLLYLYIFGNNVEDRLGRLRFLGFYLVSGYAATYLFALSTPDSHSTLVGASGAIAGVLGAYLVLFPRARVWSLVPFFFFIPLRLPAWLVLGSWFLLQWLYSSGGGVAEGSDVAYLAHVAGFVVGALLVWPLRGRRPAPESSGWGYGGPAPPYR